MKELIEVLNLINAGYQFEIIGFPTSEEDNEQLHVIAVQNPDFEEDKGNDYNKTVIIKVVNK